MLSKFRNLSKSTVGTIALFGFMGLIVASFALADLANVSSGGFGLGSNTLAKAGDKEVTDLDMTQEMERQLNLLRQTNPEATYADLAGDFDPILRQQIQDRALWAFAEANGLRISKALVDAEIARLPGAIGLDGRLTPESYQAFLARARLTDQQVRRLITADLNQRLLVAPVGAEPRLPTAFSRTYASMLLEQRTGLLGLIPTAEIAGAIDVTDAEVEEYYERSRLTYTIPQRKVLRIAQLNADRFSDMTATPQEIADALAAREGEFGAREIRVISQVVVADRATADAIVERTRNDTFVNAVAPENFSAADISVGPQNKSEFRDLAGQEVADAVFDPDVGPDSVVGPIRSPFGWHVVKVDGITVEQGQDEAAARAEAIAEIEQRKRGNALADLIVDVEDDIADGSTLDEVIERYDLELLVTPPITALGRAPGQPSFVLPEELFVALREFDDLLPEDDPETVSYIDGNGYALVKVDEVVEPAPPPLSEIRQRVRSDLVTERAVAQARQLAQQIRDAVADGTPMADAVAEVEAETGLDLPAPEETQMRLLDLTRFGQNAPPPLRMLFRLSEGAVQLAGDPTNQGIFIVQLISAERGDASAATSLIAETNEGFLQPVASEIQLQFLNALEQDIGVTRNEEAIEASRTRIIGGGN
ncbi:peptidylprolyl isomerase [Sphingomicrobium sediminis]|uniref:Parvulin-like PPIase n=1 Tax=Sphingomicrobium sediminis TaxID=2950949 RepID=A0A9X2J1R6_9SPHN|nr:peptidylprolyl isomerase [Sphingomicrobium sediminis]MCM8557004.1 peptidylprolyl isomerase [Sphingomicrobium sediminis]